MARPSKYRPEFVTQAEKLCKLGATDLEVAEALSGGEDEFLSAWLRIHREDRNGVVAVQKKARSAAKRRRLYASPSARVRNATSARIWAALKGRSDGALFSRLGYPIDTLVSHLEDRFQPGMSWSNYGRWHVDHIRPCALFNLADEAEFAECWSLNNLQPLWAVDNVAKGAKYGAP